MPCVKRHVSQGLSPSYLSEISRRGPGEHLQGLSNLALLIQIRPVLMRLQP